MSVKLIHLVTSRPSVFEPLNVRAGVTYVGRTDDNGLVLKSSLVSRRHAKLILTDMGLTVHDLDSHNGVFLNGKKVRSSPVAPGDQLYFADVCLGIELIDEPNDQFALESSLNKSNLVKAALSDSDDPAARNLAAIIRVSDTLVSSAEEEFYVEALGACRDLTQATVAVLVKRSKDGSLETPIVLHEGTAPPSETPVSWPVVRRCVDERETLFSRDTRESPLVDGDLLGADAVGAVMCVPILHDDVAKGAIYLSHAAGSDGFTDREVETLSAIAHLMALRMRQKRRPDDATQVRPLGDTDEGHGFRTAEERSNMESELRDARQKLTEFEASSLRTAALENDLSAKSAEVARLTGLLSEKSEALSLNDRDRDEAEGALGLLRDRLEEEQALTASTKESLAKAERDGAAAKARVAELQSLLDEAKSAESSVNDDATRAHTEIARLSQDLAKATFEREEAQSALDVAARNTGVAEVEERLARLVKVLAPPVRGRRDRVMDGDDSATTPLQSSTVALVAALSGVDAWSADASVGDVKSRIDRFAALVANVAEKHGGVVDNTLGHAHLVVFKDEKSSVEAAVACGIDLVEQFATDDIGGIQCGLHAATSTSGFFGDEGSLVYAHLGEAVAIARGTCEYARPGTLWVTDAIRERLGDSPPVMLIATGPHLIREFRMNPINLFQVGPRG